MRSEAATVDDYLEDLPEERRRAIERVRGVILEHLPAGYEEVMNWGMITYQVPFDTHPDTYNGKPLMYAGLASHKNHMAVYLTSVWMEPGALENFRSEYLATGKKLDMGKSCVRFRKLDDLPLELIGEAIGSVAVDDFIALSERARS